MHVKVLSILVVCCFTLTYPSFLYCGGVSGSTAILPSCSGSFLLLPCLAIPKQLLAQGPKFHPAGLLYLPAESSLRSSCWIFPVSPQTCWCLKGKRDRKHVLNVHLKQVTVSWKALQIDKGSIASHIALGSSYLHPSLFGREEDALALYPRAASPLWEDKTNKNIRQLKKTDIFRQTRLWPACKEDHSSKWWRNSSLLDKWDTWDCSSINTRRDHSNVSG